MKTQTCECGELLERRQYHVADKLWQSIFCWKCGYETTSVQTLIDRTLTAVSSDEVIEVHVQMATIDWKELSK